MNKLTRWLLVLLAVQLIIAVIIYVAGTSNQVNYQSSPLLGFDKPQLTKIVIIDGTASHSSEQNISSGDEKSNSEETTNQLANNSQVILVKQDEQWVLPQLNHLPVSQVKLDLAIGKLMGLKTSWPIATTDEAQQRFEVAEQKFKKKIQLFSGEKLLGELLIGTSPGFKKVHLRRTNENEIYSLELNSYEFPAEANDWLNKGLLQITGVQQIQFDDFSLQKENDKWTLLPKELIEAGKLLDQQKVEKLVDKLSSFNILKLLTENQEIESAKKHLLKVKAEQAYQLSLYQDEDNYWIKRDDVEALFSISSFDFEALTEVNLAELFMDAVNPEGENESNGELESGIELGDDSSSVKDDGSDT
jgi:hypothetical protein